MESRFYIFSRIYLYVRSVTFSRVNVGKGKKRWDLTFYISPVHNTHLYIYLIQTVSLTSLREKKQIKLKKKEKPKKRERKKNKVVYNKLL